MSFRKYQKEDLQDDTLGTLKVVLQSVVDAQYKMDAVTMYKGMDAFYCLLWSRMKNQKNSEQIKADLDELANLLFSGRALTTKQNGEAYEKARALWLRLTGQLNEMGLLFRLFTDPNLLVTQRSDT